MGLMHAHFRLATFLLAACTSGTPATRPVSSPTPTTGEPVYDDNALATPMRPIDPAKPEYPRELQMAGRCGSVDLQYIVGPDGRAEPGSIQVLTATEPAFGRSAAQSIQRSRFSPALIAGKPVRSRVKQRIDFKIAGVC
jgi:protein TonB